MSNLWNEIKTEMLKNPKQIVCEDNTKKSYSQIIEMAEKFAQSIDNEKCCAVMCDSQLMEAIALLACFAANVTAVPLSLRYGELYCNKILDMLSPSAVITNIGSELEITHLKRSIYTTPKEHPALIMYTSGTSGNPKGAMLSEQNILANVNDILKYFNIDKEDLILISRPLYHCAVLTGEFLTALFKGVKIQFYSETFNPRILLDLIKEKQITVFAGTPTLISILSRFIRKNEKIPLKKICISGESMSKETGRGILNAFPNAEIYHVYGLTEASPRISYLSPNLFKEFPDCVGVPLDSVDIKIIKPDGETASNGEEGVLWVRGDNIMIGYYNAPKLTAKVLKKGWLCTGDIALINENGLLQIKGRNDDLIIRAGMNIYPQEIENSLKCDNRVQDALVYKIETSKDGVQIGLKISGDFAGVDDVKKLCKEVLPDFQIPSHIELLKELPKNGSGKIIRWVKNA